MSRSIREHRTAARAWDTARAASTTTRKAGDSSWQQWAKKEARSTRRQLKAQTSKRQGGK
jgi:hypothetical protein